MNKSQKSRVKKVVQHLDKLLDFGHRALGELPRTPVVEGTDHRMVIQESLNVIERVQAQLAAEAGKPASDEKGKKDKKPKRPEPEQTDIEDFTDDEEDLA